MYHFDPDNQSITKLPINFREKMPNYVDVVEFLILKIVARENIDNDYIIIKQYAHQFNFELPV
jgi:hypothetical protein